MGCREMMRLMDSGACAKIENRLSTHKRAWASERFFPGGAIVNFARWWANSFFQEWANSGEISFYQLEANRQTFFC